MDEDFLDSLRIPSEHAPEADRTAHSSQLPLSGAEQSPWAEAQQSRDRSYAGRPEVQFPGRLHSGQGYWQQGQDPSLRRSVARLEPASQPAVLQQQQHERQQPAATFTQAQPPAMFAQREPGFGSATLRPSGSPVPSGLGGEQFGAMQYQAYANAGNPSPGPGGQAYPWVQAAAPSNPAEQARILQQQQEQQHLHLAQQQGQHPQPHASAGAPPPYLTHMGQATQATHGSVPPAGGNTPPPLAVAVTATADRPLPLQWVQSLQNVRAELAQAAAAAQEEERRRGLQAGAGGPARVDAQHIAARAGWDLVVAIMWAAEVVSTSEYNDAAATAASAGPIDVARFVLMPAPPGPLHAPPRVIVDVLPSRELRMTPAGGRPEPLRVPPVQPGAGAGPALRVESMHALQAVLRTLGEKLSAGPQPGAPPQTVMPQAAVPQTAPPQTVMPQAAVPQAAMPPRVPLQQPAEVVITADGTGRGGGNRTPGADDDGDLSDADSSSEGNTEPPRSSPAGAIDAAHTQGLPPPQAQAQQQQRQMPSQALPAALQQQQPPQQASAQDAGVGGGVGFSHNPQPQGLQQGATQASGQPSGTPRPHQEPQAFGEQAPQAGVQTSADQETQGQGPRPEEASVWGQGHGQGFEPQQEQQLQQAGAQPPVGEAAAEAKQGLAAQPPEQPTAAPPIQESQQQQLLQHPAPQQPAEAHADTGQSAQQLQQPLPEAQPPPQQAPAPEQPPPQQAPPAPEQPQPQQAAAAPQPTFLQQLALQQQQIMALAGQLLQQHITQFGAEQGPQLFYARHGPQLNAMLVQVQQLIAMHTQAQQGLGQQGQQGQGQGQAQQGQGQQGQTGQAPEQQQGQGQAAVGGAPQPPLGLAVIGPPAALQLGPGLLAGSGGLLQTQAQAQGAAGNAAGTQQQGASPTGRGRRKPARRASSEDAGLDTGLLSPAATMPAPAAGGGRRGGGAAARRSRAAAAAWSDSEEEYYERGESTGRKRARCPGNCGSGNAARTCSWGLCLACCVNRCVASGEQCKYANHARRAEEKREAAGIHA